MTAAILEAKNLTKIYPGNPPVTALSNITLAVDQAAFVMITGNSGSGKTTLLNLFGTLDQPTAGQILIEGFDISTLKGNALADFRRQKIGLIFQLYNLIPTLTALENVMLPLIPYRHTVNFSLERRAKEILDQVGLAHRLDHLPGQLSGGEQQRVAIARALLTHPTLILADEPTGNLDSKNGREIVALLRQLNEEKQMTLLMVTHDRSLVSPTDTFIQLRDGQLSEGADAHENP